MSGRARPGGGEATPDRSADGGKRPNHAAPDAPAIALDGLGRRYGRQFVLRDVSLVVAAGRIVVLTGSNGAGKTTLLRVLATRLRPSRGAGRVFGFDLVRDAPAVRASVAYLGVLGGSHPALSARENLRLAAALHGRTADVARHADALLERVDLTAAADKLVREFSSGMKKRLAIARLLLADAPLWLLDEPYAALDDAGKRMVDALLATARAEGRTVLMASHEVERSGPLADAVVEVADGGIRAASHGVTHRAARVAAHGAADGAAPASGSGAPPATDAPGAGR